MEDKEKIDFFNLLLSVESVDDLKQHVINRIKEREGYIRELEKENAMLKGEIKGLNKSLANLLVVIDDLEGRR